MRDTADDYRGRQWWRHPDALYWCGMALPGMDVIHSGIYFGWLLLIVSSFGNIARNIQPVSDAVQ
jgi:hypothetical protein